MANYNPANLLAPVYGTGNGGNATLHQGQAAVSANLASGDKVRPCIIPGGTLVHRVMINNPDLDSGTTLTATVGFAPTDGSDAGQAESVAADAAWGRAAAVTTVELWPPVLVAADSYLEIAATAAGVGTGTVYGKVEGEAKGIA